jgi:hypothetical protein
MVIDERGPIKRRWHDKSAPTVGQSRVFHGIIGPDGCPDYFVNVHNRALRWTQVGCWWLISIAAGMR